MVGVWGGLLMSLAVCSVSAYRSPVDCAFTVWRNGPTRSLEFWGNVLAGDAPSFSLGGGKRYTLSRDIVLAQDSVIDAAVYPYYKSLISNIIGAICGEFGGRPQDNRLHIITFDDEAHDIHPFSYDQDRQTFQDVILRTRRSSDYSADLNQAVRKARTPLNVLDDGARPYHNATKEVLLVTKYKSWCSRALIRSARALQTTATVHVIVVGGDSGDANPPRNWCMESLASTPTRGHFLHLRDISEIAAASRTLLAQFPINYFCLASGSSGGSHY